MFSSSTTGMPLFLVLSLLLILPATAKPISNQSGQTIQNGNLTYDPSPIGPDDLEIFVRQSRVPIDKENCLHVALGAVAKQALTSEWNSRLTERRITWTGPPGIRLVADSLYMQPMEQRVVVWTILRIIDHIIRANNYVATGAQVIWRGESIGVVSIQIIPPGPSTDKGDTIRLPETLAEIAVTEVEADALSFEAVRYEGNPIPMEEVFRSSIAAVNTISQVYRRNENIMQFSGNWPHTPNSVWHDWRSRVQPSRFHKNALLVSILTVINYAMERNDYRALRGVVKNHGRYCGEGGYSIHTALDESSDVATSRRNLRFADLGVGEKDV